MHRNVEELSSRIFVAREVAYPSTEVMYRRLSANVSMT